MQAGDPFISQKFLVRLKGWRRQTRLLMDDSLEEPWGLLVAKEGGEDERVPVLGKEFTIGRAKGINS